MNSKIRLAALGLPLLLVAALHLPRSPGLIPYPDPQEWAPPLWHPDPEALLVLPALDALAPDGLRTIRSKSGILADLDAGTVLWARDADTPRPVASITKIVSALALASFGANLEQTLCVDAQLWTARPGASSRFETGSCHSGWDFLGAALVGSDNRGAWALPRLADRTTADFVAQMKEVSADLRMETAAWVDPTGIEDEDIASPRDVLKAIVAVASHPTLSYATSAPQWALWNEVHPRLVSTTNRLSDAYDFKAAKTGYTDAARYCFTGVVEHEGHRLAFALLGAPTESARFADAEALVRWATEGRDLP